jgi:hypothetical protein
MNRILIAIVLVLTPVSAQSAPPQIPDEDRWIEAPIGRLGYQIGSYLTIEGVRIEKGHGKVGVRTLLVDTIGEYKLDKPISIWIENCDLPSGERCILKGYEAGKWIGIPDEVGKAEGKISQFIFQFSFYFTVTSVVQPQTLKTK